ncbi:MAG: hypothetical protein IKW98_06675 [Prevotella sp.]|nr:hypothetical protein [Prevotella sp.]
MAYQTDFHSPWQDLPKVKTFNGVDIHFVVEKELGWFNDNFHYTIQVMRNDQCCTLTFHIIHDLFDTGDCHYNIDNPNLERLTERFPHSLPPQIKERYPLLTKLSKREILCNFLSFHCFDNHAYFDTCNMSIKKVVDGELSDIQANFIIKAADTVLQAEQEYESYKKSVIYKNIKEAFVKQQALQKSKQEKAQTALGIYKAVRFGLLCYNLMNGNSDSYSDGGSFQDFNSVDLSGMDLSCDVDLFKLDDNPAFVDYLTSPADQVVDNPNGSLIPFGNSYDENAVKFLETCKENGVDIPSNVNTSTDSYSVKVDRDYNGGLTGIDKVVIGNKLDDMLSKGDLSQQTYDELKSKLSKT